MKKSYLEIVAVVIMGIFAIISCLPNNQKVTNYPVGDSEMRYTGKLHNGKFEGKGTLKTKEGVYIGHFSEGRFDGEVYFAKDDKDDKKSWSYKGTFEKGRPVGKAKIQTKDQDIVGKVMDGEFRK